MSSRKTLALIFVLIALLSCSPANAHTYLNLCSLGIKAGVALIGEVHGNLFSPGIYAEIGHMAPELSLVALAEYRHSNYTEEHTINSGFFSYSHSEAHYRDTDVALGLLVIYEWNDWGTVHPYTGLGLANHIFSYRSSGSSIDSIAPGLASTYSFNMKDNFTQLCVHLVAGVEIPITSPLYFAPELKFISGGHYNYFSAYLGLSYRFNRKLPEP
jgi:hypothetical protein